MQADRLGLALLMVWVAVSAIALLVLVAPLLLPADSLLGLLPQCEWQARHGRPCPLCGMTTAFVLISQGRLDEARQANRSSLALWGLLVANECAIAWVLARGVWARRRGRASRLLPVRSRT